MGYGNCSLGESLGVSICLDDLCSSKKGIILRTNGFLQEVQEMNAGGGFVSVTTIIEIDGQDYQFSMGTVPPESIALQAIQSIKLGAIVEVILKEFKDGNKRVIAIRKL